jgi:hypothetical protein
VPVPTTDLELDDIIAQLSIEILPDMDGDEDYRAILGGFKLQYRTSTPTSNVVEMKKNMLACLDDVPLLQMRQFVPFVDFAT